jgi:hypothetical protein
MKLKAKGLLPNTAFAVFLAGDFVGEIATNADGRGSMRAATPHEGDSLHLNLTPAVLRFAGPAVEDLCFKPEYEEVEGISVHRRSPSATTTLIADGQSMNDDHSVFHTINWRSIKCVSTF